MFKVVLWDYTGESAYWAKNFFKDGVEIVRTLRPDDPDQAEVIMRGDWNFVLIFENGQRELFNEIFKTMREMNFSAENIIFAKDFDDWVRNPAATYALPKPQFCDQVLRQINFFNHKRWHRYIAADAEGFHYVGTSADNFIMWYMSVKNKNWAADEMKLFYELSKKYYGVDDSTGYFLDLGANIGTTGIYFLKKFTPNLKLLAFEPDAENFKLLRVNTILNDLEERATLINCGLGEKFDEMTMYRDLHNPGNDSLFKLDDSQPTETIKIIPLDAYLSENKIAAEDVKYIWIDTEGFEAQVLLGAKNLLAKNPAPLFMEFNPMVWNKSGNFEKFFALLQGVGYTHFIWVLEMIQSGKEILHPLEKLFDWKNSTADIGSQGDIFLIRR